MNISELRYTLDSWAAWVQDGRPLHFNSYPPKSIINKFREAEHYSPPGPRPLWRGRLKSAWLDDVHRVIMQQPQERQCILLGMHLPGRGTDAERAQALGITIEKVRYARRALASALEMQRKS